MKKSTVRGYPGFPFANITYLSIHMQWCVLQFWRVISLSLTKLKFSVSTEQFFFFYKIFYSCILQHLFKRWKPPNETGHWNMTHAEWLMTKNWRKLDTLFKTTNMKLYVNCLFDWTFIFVIWKCSLIKGIPSWSHQHKML